MPEPRISLDHVVLEVRNAEAALAFYGGLLGLAPVRLKEFRGGKAPFPSGRVARGTMIDFFPPALWKRRRSPSNPNHVSFALGRQAVVALRKRMAQRGIAIEREMGRNYGARGWGSAFYFSDPEGNTVEVRCYARIAAASGQSGGRPRRRRPVQR